MNFIWWALHVPRCKLWLPTYSKGAPRKQSKLSSVPLFIFRKRRQLKLSQNSYIPQEANSAKDVRMKIMEKFMK
jgi:hypothetical protein